MAKMNLDLPAQVVYTTKPEDNTVKVGNVEVYCKKESIHARLMLVKSEELSTYDLKYMPSLGFFLRSKEGVVVFHHLEVKGGN